MKKKIGPKLVSNQLHWNPFHHNPQNKLSCLTCTSLNILLMAVESKVCSVCKKVSKLCASCCARPMPANISWKLGEKKLFQNTSAEQPTSTTAAMSTTETQDSNTALQTNPEHGSTVAYVKAAQRMEPGPYQQYNLKRNKHVYKILGAIQLAQLFHCGCFRLQEMRGRCCKPRLVRILSFHILQNCV